MLSIIELDWLQYPSRGCYVAETYLVRFLLAERQTTAYVLQPGARIVAIAVEPSLRRARIGKILVQALERQARYENIKQIYSILLAEVESDSKFLESYRSSTSDLKIYAKRV
ncbi:MAG: GNAT family N-acetyltransferase [Chloroflexi bacterium]|nr:GNAT family N-acetyltransferase [Chloroflexota bacterium]MBT5892896.1 GNAT family N-acetyltransferase [Chloroflexota bacterium]MBT7004861.1 GNAT family N-acetyltransferase [Chloroflexota bacterium]